MSNSQYDFVFKIVIIGNSSVGKSSLLLRFADDVFHQTFLPTIGVDFKIRTIQQGGSKVKLQMWDTAGQEKFKNIVSAYYKGAQGILLVFDVCDPRSFQDVKNWLSEVDNHSNRPTVKFLVGNKCDLQSERRVTKEQAQRFAQNEGMCYYEASAKTKYNVDTLFKAFAEQMKEKNAQQYIEKYKTTKTCNLPIKPTEYKPVGSKKTTCC